MKADLNHLETLLAIVDEGSFEGAAALLRITPSAVSQRLKALEQQVGMVLMRRSKPVQATDAALPYVQAARQIQAVVDQTLSPAEGANSRLPVIPFAANADSMDSWLVPALASVADVASFQVFRDDQDHTPELLRSGTVMAGIASHEVPVQGCEATRLGVMRYLPLATQEFAEAWFPELLRSNELQQQEIAVAPAVYFDRKDRLQDAYLHSLGVADVKPPTHYLPSNMAFMAAISQDMGWGMVPEQLANEHLENGSLINLGGYVDITLYWQQWNISTPQLDALKLAVTNAANYALRQS